MNGLYFNEFYNTEIKTILSLKNEYFNPERDLVNFVNTRYRKEMIGIFVDSNESLEMIKLILINYGIQTVTDYKELKAGNVYVGMPASNVYFDSVILYLISNPKEYISCAALQKFVIVNKEVKIEVDEYKLPMICESIYYLHKSGMISFAKDFAFKLFEADESQMGLLFNDPRFYNDMAFMGLVSLVSNFKFTTIYEQYRLSSCREEIIKYVGINLHRFFKEIIDFNKLYLVENVFHDYNKEMILRFALENDLRIFDNINSDLRYRLFVICDRTYEVVNKGIYLGLWNLLDVYQYNILDLYFFDVRLLAKEAEYALNKDIIIKMLDDFDNKIMLDVAVSIRSNNYEDLAPHIREQIFLRVYDSHESLEDGYVLKIWSLEDLYEYALKHEDTKSYIIQYLYEGFESFSEIIDKHKRGDLANRIYQDFEFETILERGIRLVKYFDYDTRYKLYLESLSNKFRFADYYKTNMWSYKEVFIWYLEDKVDFVKEYLDKDLLKLIQEINRNKDEELYLKVFKNFDVARVLVYTGNCNAAYLLQSFNEEERKDLFEELCNRFDCIEAGIKLRFWNSVVIYKFGLSNIMQKENIIRAIKRNLDVFVHDLALVETYDLIDSIIEDFEVIDLFDEAYTQKKNIFLSANERSKEEIIKAVFDNIKYLDWLTKDNSYSAPTIFRIAQRNNLNITKFYQRNYTVILPAIDPSDYLAYICILSKLEEQSVTEISRHFHRGKGKRLSSVIESHKKNGYKLDLINKGLTKRFKSDLSKEEMLSLLSEV